MKSFKGFMLALIILAIMGGAGYMLMVMDIIPTPAFMTKIPVLGGRLATEGQTDLSPQARLRQDNDKLTQELADREGEIKDLQADLAEAQRLLQQSRQDNQELQTQIASLQEQLTASQNRQADQKAAYKDMARYFVEMKAKDAAELLSRQRDQDIIGILGEMQPAQAAEILQNMEREKAAAITRQMLAVSS